MNLNIVIFLLFLLQMLTSCASSTMTKYSGRSPNVYTKSNLVKMYGKSHEFLEEEKEKPKIFVKRSNIDIAERPKPNINGSLFQSSDKRNFLFFNQNKLQIGNHVKIKIKAGRELLDNLQKKEETAEQDQAAGEAQNEEDAESDELLKAFLC